MNVLKKEDVEYVRTNKKRYLKVLGKIYKYNQNTKYYFCSNKACHGKVKKLGLNYYQLKPCDV